MAGGTGGFEQSIIQRGGMALAARSGGGDDTVHIDETGETGAEPEELCLAPVIG